MKIIFRVVALAVCVIASSCQKPANNHPAPSGDYQHGVWFINEGVYMFGNASLDFYHKDKDTVESDVFENVNGKPIGDTFESMFDYNGHYFFVLNNPGGIVVVDDKTIKVSAIIPNIVNDRYFLPVSNQKAYVTDNTGRGINIIDLENNKISGLISYDPKPDSAYKSWTEQMVQFRNKVYVAAVKTGKLLIINSITDKIIDTVPLNVGAEDVVMDKQNRIWVSCDGTIPSSHINSKLFCLDTTGKVLKEYTFSDVSTGLTKLTINATGDTLYYIYGDVYKMGINEGSLPSTSIVKGDGRVFYGLGIDPANNDIYVGYAPGYTQPGIVFQYSSSGELLKTHHSGINPNGFLFVP